MATIYFPAAHTHVRAQKHMREHMHTRARKHTGAANLHSVAMSPSQRQEAAGNGTTKISAANGSVLALRGIHLPIVHSFMCT